MKKRLLLPFLCLMFVLGCSKNETDPIQQIELNPQISNIELEQPLENFEPKYTEDEINAFYEEWNQLEPTKISVEKWNYSNKKKQGRCGNNQSPLYLDDNGVTIKSRKCKRSLIGEKHILKGVEYEIVDNHTLYWKVQKGEDVSKVVTTFVTNMNRLFYNQTKFNQDISSWDTSNVRQMGGTFENAISFNQDIGQWDVSKVRNMFEMFRGAFTFNQDIGQWDVSKVKNMYQMFYCPEMEVGWSWLGGINYNSHLFNQDISKWDVSSVEDMYGMFRRAKLFNQDISKWDVSNVYDMSYMFAGAMYFNQDIGNWDVSNVTNMNSMFKGFGLFSKHGDPQGTSWRGTEFNQDIGKWNVSSVEDMGYMFYDAIYFNQDISKWDVSNVTDMGYMFAMEQYNFHIANARLSHKFNQDISEWDVSNVTYCKHFSNTCNGRSGTSYNPPKLLSTYKPEFSNCHQGYRCYN
ncbi:MAG: BspA family leucine-rich repeat surface protein [Flavobacteriaceae bacterium]|nr:BspA family leucine-rich repeat surface protein [Flavobacteriaceae bacterium]